MVKKFLYLEWKQFSRSASFKTNVAIKIILSIVGAIYLLGLLSAGVAGFYALKKFNLDPLVQINKYIVYYILGDLAIRFFMQKIPILNIRPLLNMPFKKATIVHFSLGKTALSFFNISHSFLFLPLTILLLIDGYDVVSVLLWHLSMFSLIYINNYLNIILNNKDAVFYGFVVVVLGLVASQYYGFFNITDYSINVFGAFFNTKWAFLIPVIALIFLYNFTFNYFKNDLYLDAGLASKHEIAKTEDLTWLNQFGTLGTFIKNDIKLIKRNKRSKTTVLMSVIFLFYGLLFFSKGMGQAEVMKIFAGIFVSGGFLFTFGQFVPSWDSAYYPLMMTQNIPYRNYLTSKWWLIVIATCISTIAASFYLFMGWEVYLTIVVAAIYNIGVNSHLVLYAGAYTKTPVDLGASKGAFGDKKAFNIQTMLISLPKLLLPVLLYAVGLYIFNANTGLALVAIAGVLGFAFRNKMFSIIEKVYKTEKYKTIDAYKQKG